MLYARDEFVVGHCASPLVTWYHCSPTMHHCISPCGRTSYPSPRELVYAPILSGDGLRRCRTLSDLASDYPSSHPPTGDDPPESIIPACILWHHGRTPTVCQKAIFGPHDSCTALLSLVSCKGQPTPGAFPTNISLVSGRPA